MKKVFVVVSLILSWSFGILQSSPPVALGKPEVSKIDWNMRSIIHDDMNGDGKNDLVFINNDEAKIEIMLQRDPGSDVKSIQRSIRQGRWDPVLEDSRYLRESLTSGTTMYAVASGDLNGDGLKDLAYTGKQEPLNIRYQMKDGGFTDDFVYDNFKPAAWTSTITITDLNADGANELIVLGAEKILIFQQNKDGLIDQPDSIQLTNKVSYGLKIDDVNSDGKLDIMYLENNTDWPLRVRFQKDNCVFGPELSFEMEAGSDIVHSLGQTSQGPAYVHIQAKTQQLEIFTLKNVSKDNMRYLQPEIYTMGISGKNSAIYAMGAFEMLGLTGIVAVDPKESMMQYSAPLMNGGFSQAKEYPTLTNVSQLLSGSFGMGGDGLLVFSEREKVIGYTEYSNGRFKFPSLIDVKGDPQALAVGDMNSDGYSDVVILSKEKKKYSFRILSKRTGDKFEELLAVSLDNVVRVPKSIQIHDFNNDSKLDILLLVSREPARIFLRGEGNAFDEVALVSSVRKSFLHDLSEAEIGFGDVDGSGSEELLVVNEGFVRAIRLNEDSELEVVDQFNAQSSDDKIKTPLVVDIDHEGGSEMVFYDRKQAGLQVLQKEDDGVFRYSHTIELGLIDPTSARIFRDSTGKATSIVYFGTDRFWNVPLAKDTWKLNVLSTYETDLEKVTYNMIETGDLNNDGIADILVMDGQNHVMEILTWNEKDDWQSRLHFTVFDVNMHYQGRKGAALEPREAVIGDFTGDDLNDVAILVHDRMLVYPQLNQVLSSN